MRHLFLLLTSMFIGIGAYAAQSSSNPNFSGGWEYQSVSEATRSYFEMPQQVIGVFNNSYELPGRNSAILMLVPQSLSWKAATFSVVRKIKKKNNKLMIKSTAYPLNESSGSIYVSEYLWTPVNKSQVVAIIHIKKKDKSYLLLTDIDEADYTSKKSFIHGLALEIFKKQDLKFPQQ